MCKRMRVISATEMEGHMGESTKKSKTKEIPQKALDNQLAVLSYEHDKKRYEDVAMQYLRDAGGTALISRDSPLWNGIEATLISDPRARVSNVDLANLQVAGFNALSAQMAASTVVLSKELQGLGSYVKDAHSETMAGLKVIQQNIQALNGNLVTLGGNLSSIASVLAELHGEFEEYVANDAKVQAAQRATTQMGNLEQRLQNQFGQNKELRRIAEGILQATDLAGVRTETILTSAEELMVKTPQYWLAPAVLVLARWVAASQDSSEADVQQTRQVMSNMLNEAYRRDRNKTALFFGVICRRANMIDESNAWFQDYMSFQQPDSVDRTVIMLMNLYTSGAMGHGDAETQMLSRIYTWQYDQLHGESDVYRQQIKDDWKAKCQELIAKAPESRGDFQALRNFSKDWGLLSRSLQASQLHQQLSQFLEHELSLRDFDQSQTQALDSALRSLVSDYDGAELPIRREYEYQKLIVDLGGNVAAARMLRGIKDDILTETKPMVSILTDAARDSELTSASAATHVFALRTQMPYIRQAYKECVDEYRRNTPSTISIALGDWTSTMSNGSEEPQLQSSFKSHVDKVQQDGVDALKVDNKKMSFYIWLGILVAGILCLFASPILGIILTIFGGYFAHKSYATYKKALKKKEKLEKDMQLRRTYGSAIIWKLCSEMRDYRAEYCDNEGGQLPLERMLYEEGSGLEKLAAGSKSTPVDAASTFAQKDSSNDPEYQTN